MSAKAERLVNLVVALLQARTPLTFAQLRDRMGEWQDGEHESMRRKFERDKDELRRLGVPVETVPVDAFGSEVAYRIDRDAYEQPDVELDVEQVSAIAVALQLLEGDADRLVWSKIGARAPDPRATTAPPGLRVAVDLDATVPLADAVVERRVVRFRYRTRAGDAGTRTVDPAAVVLRGGVTYLLGRDHDRDALRAFRLDRLLGDVEVLDAAAGPVPTDLDIAALVSGPDSAPVSVGIRHADGRVEERSVPPGRATERVLRHAPDLAVTGPPALVADVRSALAAVLARHEGAEA